MNPSSFEEFWQCFPTSKAVPYARYRCSLTPSLSPLVSDYLRLSLQMEGEGEKAALASCTDPTDLASVSSPLINLFHCLPLIFISSP